MMLFWLQGGSFYQLLYYQTIIFKLPSSASSCYHTVEVIAMPVLSTKLANVETRAWSVSQNAKRVKFCNAKIQGIWLLQEDASFHLLRKTLSLLLFTGFSLVYSPLSHDFGVVNDQASKLLKSVLFRNSCNLRQQQSLKNGWYAESP